MNEPLTRKALFAPTVSLFASTSTLLCCALPALLVTIGAGAVMAGIASNVPGYVWLTAHKAELFVMSGGLLGLAVWLRWRSRNAPCPVDPQAAQACNRLRKVSGLILSASIIIYLIGGFFAFFAAKLFF